MTLDDLLQGIATGDRRGVARALSLVESTAAADRELVAALLERLPARNARRIGITGSPGVGKSTLIETLGMALCERGEHVAVLAVDPSSRRSGGSILGDKVRMPNLSNHERALVRPSPSRSALGGATDATRESILVCEAAGYTTVIVETVGVGQSEVDVSDMVDVFAVLVLPTSGDDIQGIKRGIMEVADIVVVTKADIDATATHRATAQMKGALRYMLPNSEDWTVPVIPVSSVTDAGLEGLVQALDAWYIAERTPYRLSRRERQRHTWFHATLRGQLIEKLMQHPETRVLLERALHQVHQGNMVPSAAVHGLLSSLSIRLTEPS